MFPETAKSLRELIQMIREADEDSRRKAIMMFLGTALMGLAIIGAFGLWGVLFCVGWLLLFGSGATSD